MAYFDKFDICEAYLAIEMDWNIGGLVKGKSYSSQLHKIGFSASPLFKGYKSLSDNGKEIYWNQCYKLNLISEDEWNEMLEDDGGYE